MLLRNCKSQLSSFCWRNRLVSVLKKDDGLRQNDPVYQLVKRIRSQKMPSSQSIVAEAAKELGLMQGYIDPSQVLEEFNNNLRKLFVQTLQVLERYEELVYSNAVMPELTMMRSDLIEKLTGKNNVELVSRALQSLYPDLWRVFLSRSQSRKQRGGQDFQDQIKTLFQLTGIPFDEQTRDYHTDFVIPSQDFYEKDRTRAMIFSIKRTLRERWQEVVEELYHTRCPNVYLATADDATKISTKTHVEGIRRYNMHLVVWDDVKREKFPGEPAVKSYTDFAKREIPTFRGFWNNARPS